MSLVSGTGWSVLSALAPLVARLAAAVVCARMLGQSETGRLVYLLWLPEVLAQVVFTAIQQTVTRFVAELRGSGRRADALLGWGMRVFAGFVPASALIIVAVAASVDGQAGSRLDWALVAAYFAGGGLAGASVAHLDGRRRFDLSARVNLAAAVLLVVGVWAGAAHAGVTGALAGYVLSILPGCAAGVVARARAGRAPEGVDAELQRRLRRFLMYGLGAALVSVLVWSRSEIWFLERYHGPSAVARFGVALTLAGVVAQLPALLSGAFLTWFSERHGARESATVSQAYGTGTRLVALLVFPMAFVSAALATPLVRVVYGDIYADAGPVAAVLFVAAALGVANIGSALINAVERIRFIAIGGCLGGAVMVAAGFTVIARFGDIGAAWTRLVVQTAMVALGTWYIAHRLRVDVPGREVGRALGCSAAAALAAAGAAAVVPPSLSIPAGFAAAAVTYIILVRLLRLVRLEDVRALRRSGRRLPATFSAPVDRLLCWVAGDA